MHTGDSPWRDNFNIGLQAVECEFEPHLVVTLSCASVRDVTELRHQTTSEKMRLDLDSLAAFCVGDRHHTASDHRPRKGCTQEINVLRINDQVSLTSSVGTS